MVSAATADLTGRNAEAQIGAYLRAERSRVLVGVAPAAGAGDRQWKQREHPGCEPAPVAASAGAGAAAYGLADPGNASMPGSASAVYGATPGQTSQ